MEKNTKTHYSRPIILCVSGFDPTGGAGILADIKTCEQIGCLGVGVLTAWTVQTESKCLQVQWLSVTEMIAQLRPLLDNYEIKFVKIGIMPDWDSLCAIIASLKDYDRRISIVWDPIFASSSGFVFLANSPPNRLQYILEKIYLMTPNYIEIRQFKIGENEEQSASSLSAYCHVLLKGGHNASKRGVDILYSNGVENYITTDERVLPSKHGSGCILSAAITAYLAKGNGLKEACSLGKKYIESRLKSNAQLLAYHNETI